MPKEEEKEYLKILGVDKYSSESMSVLDISYVLLQYIISSTPCRNFRLIVGDRIWVYWRIEALVYSEILIKGTALSYHLVELVG